MWVRWLLMCISVNAVYFSLPGHKEQCFSLSVGKGNKLYGAFIVSGKGDENMIARVFSPDGKVDYQSPRKSREGNFEITSDSGGKHKLCFKSIDSNTKNVSFEFDTRPEIEVDKLATEVEPLTLKLTGVSAQLDTVYRNIHFYERRERVHRDLIEQTCDRVLWSALLKILVLATVVAAQVVVFRGLFNKTTVGI